MNAYIKYGVLAGLLNAAINIIVSYGQLQSGSYNLIFSLLTYIAIAAAIIFAMRDRRTDQGNYLTFGQGMSTGMLVTLVASVLAAIAFYIDAKFLHHEVTRSLYNEFESRLESQELSEEEMEMALRWGKKMITPGGQAIMAFIGFMIRGLVLSLITAAVLRKEDTDNKQNNPMLE